MDDTIKDEYIEIPLSKRVKRNNENVNSSNG